VGLKNRGEDVSASDSSCEMLRVRLLLTRRANRQECIVR
jgi:hypothetical protein